MTPAAVVAANFTAQPIERPLLTWLARLGLPHRLAFAPPDQVGPSLLDPRGIAGDPAAACVVVLLRVESRARLEPLVEALAGGPAPARGTPCLVVLTPPRPGQPAEPEAWLAGALANLPVTVVTSAELARRHPVPDPHDPEAERLAGVPYTRAQFDALATVVARHLRALARPPRKALVVDCDGVLWTGACAEDGPAGVAIGEANRRLQQFLVEQSALGTMVCLCSKNAEADVMAVLTRRPDMPLRPEHLAAFRINWRPKSANLVDLAAELGVTLGDVVFVDDSPVECAEVEDACPDVLTHRFAGRPDFCDHLWALDRAYVTAEDGRRSRSMGLARTRRAARRAFVTHAEFVRSLDVRVRVEPMTHADADRMAQLSVRTTQFNASGVRRTPAEMRALLDRADRRCLSVRVTDRFEDYGLVGGAILDVSAADALVVESLFLSCRALGRGVEHRVLAALGELALELGAPAVRLPIVPTARNLPVRQFATAIPGAEVAGGPVVTVGAALAAAVEYAPPEEEPPPAPVDPVAAPAAAGELAVLREIAAGTAAAAPSEPAAAGLDEVEPRLRRMWRELLQVPAFGPQDSFFELGGTSLTAFYLLDRIRDEFRVALDADLLYDTSLTVAALAGAVRRALG